MSSFYKTHESALPPPKAFRHLFDIWLSGQTMLPDVQRWKPWVTLQGTRPQNTLQHSYSINLLTCEFVIRLLPYTEAELDLRLLYTAFMVHDHSEGELGRDVILSNKTDQKDLDEYRAFTKRFDKLPVYSFWHAAYLLQFADKCPSNFPLEAQEIFLTLREECIEEVLAFQAIENLDYLMYAIEQSLILGKRDCLAQVLQNVTPKLDHLTKRLPGLKEEFWTPEFKAWCYEMAKGGNPEVPK